MAAAEKRSSTWRTIGLFIRRFFFAVLLVCLLMAADSGMRWVLANQQQANSLVAQAILWLDGRLEELTQFAQKTVSKHLPNTGRHQFETFLAWIQHIIFGAVPQQPF